MKRLLSFGVVFAVTCLIGFGLSGVFAGDAGACYDCGFNWSCPSGQTCLTAPEPGIRLTNCQDGCCQAPTPYVYFECDGYCSGSTPELPRCDCHKAGCWVGFIPR